MSNKIINKQRLAALVSLVSIAAGLGLAMPAVAQDTPGAAALSGFYGGVSVREPGNDTVGLHAGPAVALWTRFATPTALATPAADDTSTQALLFGGYRWRNDVAVEASFSSADKYSLRPGSVASVPGVRFGMGSGGIGLSDAQSRVWNVDVYTSWAFYKSFALYGRLGYAQAETTPLFANSSAVSPVDSRRLRDGMNYGVGLRYGLSSNLGLRLEYARFARFGIDTGSVLPESDQVRFGMQFRF